MLAGITSASMLRFSNEYSTWLEIIGALPKSGFCSVAARANCQPEKFETPTYRTRPEDTAWSIAERDSSSGTIGSQV